MNSKEEKQEERKLGKILFEFESDETDGRENTDWDVLAKYAVYEAESAVSGIVIKGWTEGGREVSPWSERPIIRRLLLEIEKLKSSSATGEAEKKGNGHKDFSLRKTGADEAWSLADSVKMLIFAADILLYSHDYDGGRWEEILSAKKQAEKYLAEAGFEVPAYKPTAAFFVPAVEEKQK